MVAWFQDVRRRCFLVRFRVTTADLQSRTGILGVSRDIYGSNCIVDAMSNIVDEFVTPRAGAEVLKSRRRNQRMRPDFRRNLTNSVCLWAADGAADEQRAGRLANGKSEGLSHAETLLPAIKICLKDKTHASTRLIEQPWTVVPQLNDMLQTFIFGKSAMCQLIQHSHSLQQEFARRCREFQSTVNGERIRHLGAVKQRFASTCKPLGRTVLWFDCMISLAEWLWQTRKTPTDKEHAQNYLQAVDEQRVIIAALAADCGDEVSGVIRFFDDPSYDIASMPNVLQTFVERLDYLFIQKHATEVQGYTKFALQNLKQVRIFTCPGEGPRSQPVVRSLGGPGSEARIQAALTNGYDVMACYVRLCVTTMKAEFPGNEFLRCLTMFDLSQTCTPPDTESHCERFSQVFGGDASDLLQELEVHRRFALKSQREGSPTVDAWSKAIHQTETCRKARQKSSDTLRLAFQVYNTCQGATTSCVEQTFSGLADLQRAQRSNHLSTLMEKCELKVARSLIPSEMSEVVRRAQKIWSQHFGRPRTSFRRASVPVGPKDARSEKSWIGARRQAVTVGLQQLQEIGTKRSMEAIQQDAEEASMQEWTEKQQTFEDALKKRQRVAAAIAHDRGLLLPHEVTDDVVADAADLLAKRKAADRATNALEARRRRINNTLNIEDKVDFLNCRFYCHTALDLPCSEEVRLRNAITEAGNHTDILEVSQANVLVVHDPSAPGHTLKWIAALTGAWVVSPHFVTSHGRQGSAMAWAAPGIATTVRKVWISRKYKEQSLFWKHLRCVLNSELCRWKEVSLPELKELWRKDNARRKEQRRPMDNIALVLPRQLGHATFRGKRNVFTVESLVKKFGNHTVVANGFSRSSVLLRCFKSCYVAL